MRAFLIALSGLALKGDNCSLVNLDSHFKLNIPNFRKLGLFKCANFNDDIVKEIASLGTISTNNCSNNQQVLQMLDDNTEDNYDILSTEIPNSILETIQQIFRCKPLFCKRGDFQTAIKECGMSAKNYSCPIVYTKENESVIKIAVHEKCYKENDFFQLVEMVKNEIKNYKINCVEGKIFAGDFEFYKTQHNKVFKAVSCDSNLLTLLNKSNITTISVGKVLDIVDSSCFKENYPSKTDCLSLKTLEKLVLKRENMFVFAYLTDYEKIYSNHGDMLGARKCLEEIDLTIEKILRYLKQDDILIFTSTFIGQAKVPLLVYNSNNENCVNLGDFNSFEVIHKLIEQHFNL